MKPGLRQGRARRAFDEKRLRPVTDRPAGRLLIGFPSPAPRRSFFCHSGWPHSPGGAAGPYAHEPTATFRRNSESICQIISRNMLTIVLACAKIYAVSAKRPMPQRRTIKELPRQPVMIVAGAGRIVTTGSRGRKSVWASAPAGMHLSASGSPCLRSEVWREV